ncbi:hypothetical protein GCM10008960_05480 [Deinococcus sedimenti]|uniref:Uncharacterized protein n=1 Tax=Deinococcus sedimenti TaxID=1867090 RepID=A0ABQ2S348_9DEIO|nr:hypothetical protein GCM10008960_05480 [Deinococcus sedimenti]
MILNVAKLSRITPLNLAPLWLEPGLPVTFHMLPASDIRRACFQALRTSRAPSPTTVG